MPHHDFQRYLRVLLATAFAGIALIMGVNFAVDPLQFYHRARGYAAHYSKNQRYQAPALVRTHPYDTIVLGNSHAANFEPALVEAMLGGKALNLTLEGSAIVEQSRLAALALQQGKARRVLWLIDFNAFSVVATEAEKIAAQTLPGHLYGHPFAAAGPYLLSMDTLVDSLKALTSKPAHELATLTSWWREYTFARQRVEAAWDHLRDHWTPERRQRWARVAAGPDDIDELLERYVLDLAEQHPDVAFLLVLPPFTPYEYALDFLVSDQRAFVRFHLRERIHEAARRHSNLTVWDFEGTDAFGADLDRYKDLSHYDRHVVEHMLAVIAAGAVPATRPKDLAVRLHDFLRRRCAADAAERARFCPPAVECGARRLQDWLERGAPAHRPASACAAEAGR